jgi:hypothetical protein
MENYGKGKSSYMEQTTVAKVLTFLSTADLELSEHDREVLRPLAEEVAKIAATPAMAEKRRLWKKHNMLEPERAMVFCDPENGWNEIITRAEIQCRGNLARRWEMDLRKDIFWGKEMGDDKPVQGFFDVPYTIRFPNWGVPFKLDKKSMDGSMSFGTGLADYAADLPKLRVPMPDIDWDTTTGSVELAAKAFGDILDVRLKGMWFSATWGITVYSILLRGLEQVLYDFYDYPEELKALHEFIARSHVARLDFLEENGLISLNNDGTYVGTGGFGFTDELPRGNPKGPYTAMDCWGVTESQETVGVSADMYEEFVFPYEKMVTDRFGLNCYGCCEPLEGRWHVVKRHRNLRRVSCSPWADKAKMAELLEDKYILSLKPSPSPLAVPGVDWDVVRKELRESLEKVKGCVVEVIMKDNHTLGKRPENAVEWVRIAREEVDKVFGA